jgi:hypothetical protein
MSVERLAKKVRDGKMDTAAAAHALGQERAIPNEYLHAYGLSKLELLTASVLVGVEPMTNDPAECAETAVAIAERVLLVLIEREVFRDED